MPNEKCYKNIDDIVASLPTYIHTLYKDNIEKPYKLGDFSKPLYATAGVKRVFDVIETIMGFTGLVAAGVIYSYGYMEALRKCFEVSHKERQFIIRTRGDNPKQLTRFPMGTNLDVLRSLVHSSKTFPADNTPTFIRNLYSGFYDNINLTNDCNVSLKGISPEVQKNDLNCAVNVRNTKVAHGSYEFSSEQFESWRCYLHLCIVRRFGFWTNHMIIVKQDRMAWPMSARYGDDPTPLPIYPGHPLERFRDAEVILWTPSPEEADQITVLKEVAIPRFHDGLGEYISLFPFVLFCRTPNDYPRVGGFSMVVPQKKIFGVSVKYHGKIDDADDGYITDKRSVPDYITHKDVAVSILKHLQYLDGKRQDRPDGITPHDLIVTSETNLYHMTSMPGCILERIDEGAKDIEVSNAPGSVKLVFHCRLDSNNPRNAVLLTSIVEGAERLYRRLPENCSKPPTEEKKFITKVCRARPDEWKWKCQFLQECDQTRKLLSNQYVVDVWESGVIVNKDRPDLSGVPFYLMPKAEFNLEQRKQQRIRQVQDICKNYTKRSPLDLTKASEIDKFAYHLWVLRMISGVSKALSALHDANIIHRDLKLANVLIYRCGLVKLADLGSFAPILRRGASADLIDFLPTTLPYIPPEFSNAQESSSPQTTFIEGRRNPKSDVFMFGVLLYILLVDESTAKQSFGKHRHFQFDADLRKRIRRIDESFAFVKKPKPSFVHLIELCTKHELCDRYGTDDLLEELRDLEKEVETVVRAQIIRLLMLLGNRDYVGDRAIDIRQSLRALLLANDIGIFDCVRKERSLWERDPIGSDDDCRFKSSDGTDKYYDRIAACFRGSSLIPEKEEELLNLIINVVEECPGILYACDRHQDLRDLISDFVNSDLLQEYRPEEPLTQSHKDSDPLTTCLKLLCTPVGGLYDDT